jgi:hypothetical protein
MMNNCVKGILVLIVFWGGIAKGQVIVLPQPLSYCWPVSNPVLDTAYYLQNLAYKKNKIKVVSIYDESNILKAQNFLNKDYVVYSTLKNNYDDGSLSNEEYYEYDKYGMVSSIKFTSYYLEKNMPLNGFNTKQSFEYFENKDSKPFRRLKRQNDSLVVSEEAIYENNKLSVIKIYNTEKPADFWSCEVAYSGDTVNLCGMDWEHRIFMMITVNDSVKIVGTGMPPEYTVLKNKRIISIGDDKGYTKYFYNENGLIDYSLVKFSDSPEIKKYNYRYYYEN